MNLTQYIERRECPVCGRSSTTSVKRHFYRGEICRNEMAMRTYVAVDALLSDEAVLAGARIVSGRQPDYPAENLPPIAVRGSRDCVQAAVDAVTGTGGGA